MTLSAVLKWGGIQQPAPTFFSVFKYWILRLSKPTVNGVRLDELHLKHSFIYASAYLIMVVIIFAYVFREQVSSRMIDKYLSWEPNDQIICEDVKVSITSTFQGTLDGVWSSGIYGGFNNNQSIYEISFAGSTLTKDKYRSSMHTFSQDLKRLGEKALTRNVFSTLLSLATMMSVDDSAGISFYSSTDASIFANSAVIPTAKIADSTGVCHGYANTSGGYISGRFDQSQGSLVLELPFKLSQATVLEGVPFPNGYPEAMEPCLSQGRFVNYAFQPWRSQYDNGNAPIGFDIRTTLIVMALNSGRSDFIGLTKFSNDFLDSIGLFGATDAWYTNPPLQRLYCIDKKSPIWKLPPYSITEEQILGPPICFLSATIKSSVITPYYPVGMQIKRNSRGTNYKGFVPYEKCECAAPGIPAGPRDYWYHCERFNFAFGFFYQKKKLDLTYKITRNELWQDTFRFGFKQQQLFILNAKTGDGDLKLTDRFFDLFHAIIQASKQPNKADIPIRTSWARNQTANQWVNEAFMRVAPDMGVIFFETLSIVGDTNLYLPINKYSMELRDMIRTKNVYFDWTASVNISHTMMCSDVFTQAPTMEKLTNIPPADFTENYFVCNEKMQPAMTSAFGSSLAASAAYATLLWGVVGLISITVLRRRLQLEGAPKVLVSEQKERLIDLILTDLKDESLVAVIKALYERVEKVEHQDKQHHKPRHSHGHSDDKAPDAHVFKDQDTLAAFYRLYASDLAAVYHSDLVPEKQMQYAIVGSEVTKRLHLLRADLSEYQESNEAERSSTLEREARQSQSDSKHKRSVMELEMAHDGDVHGENPLHEDRAHRHSHSHRASHNHSHGRRL